MRNLTRYIPGWFAALIALSILITLVGIDRDHHLQPQQRLVDLIWLDHLPEHPSEPFKAYYFGVDDYGVMLEAQSAYKLIFEIFEFQQSEKNLNYNLLHRNKSHTTDYIIEKMDQPTDHFDTKLIIRKDPNNRHRKSVYFTGPEFRSHDTLPAVLKTALERKRLRLVD
jgi:hypothetical protein